MKTEKIHKCVTCKEYFHIDDVINITYHINPKGDRINYYKCNPCNTGFARKYRNTEKGKKNACHNARAYILKNPEKISARNLLRYHVRSGKIIKPKVCEICKIQSIHIEGHHEDYSKPLEVIWACRNCHRLLDRNREKRMGITVLKN